MTETQTASARDLVGKHVAGTAVRLQAQLLDRDGFGRSDAVGELSRLRRARADDPGDPRVWDLTLGGVPTGLTGHRDGPSNAERAIHAALVLFALHAQSAKGRRHVAGRRLGLAVRDLANKQANVEPVTKRFQAFATATTWSQRLYHLRGLVSLMRAHDIPLDYGSLASDLYVAQTPDGLRRIRLQWGRDFHHVNTPSQPHGPSTSPDISPATETMEN